MSSSASALADPSDPAQTPVEIADAALQQALATLLVDQQIQAVLQQQLATDTGLVNDGQNAIATQTAALQQIQQQIAVLQAQAGDNPTPEQTAQLAALQTQSDQTTTQIQGLSGDLVTNTVHQQADTGALQAATDKVNQDTLAYQQALQNDIDAHAAACYVQGTRIMTDGGLRPIEDLAIGDVVVTASGAHRPVRWTGHRHIDVTRHTNPQAVRPVRIAAAAFGEGLPLRDLWVSPGHNLFMQSVLMPARVLVNGATVAQVAVDTVTYWHVELDSHDLLLAEGLPSESYLDTGNRSAFENDGAIVALQPAIDPEHDVETFAPIRKAGPEVEAARAALLARAAEQGCIATPADDLHIVADGRRIDAIDLGPKRFAFTIPAGASSIALASRTFVPCHVDPKRTDSRTLGVCIKRLQVNGEDVDLNAALPDTVWHKAEQKPGHVQRWTKAGVPLPRSTRMVLVDLALEGLYWTERREPALARTA